ncbi:MAG: hypothetical protein ABIT71_24575 [Vicinamibacteraceae bacterium]
MRWLVLALAAVLLVPAGASAQQAWAKAYEDGVDLFEKGNLALAEQKLIEARDHARAPKQSRRANFSSVVYRPFIPDFYLGVIYARTGRNKQAQDLLERALRDELVKQDDKANFALATTSLQRVRDEQTRLASNTTRPTPPEVVRPSVITTPTTTVPTPNNTVTPTPLNSNVAVTPPPVRLPVTPPANVEPTWLPAFRRSMDAANASLRQSRYTEARSSVTAAATMAGDAARRAEAGTLRRTIDSAQNMEAQRVVAGARAAIGRKDVDGALDRVASLETLAPGHPALAELRNGIEIVRSALQGKADLANVERRGVRLFLSGNYKDSAAELQRAVGAGVTSPRIYLFLASSRAAEALLSPRNQREPMVVEARKAYALAGPGAASLATDQRFISPSILKLLTGP